MRRTTYILSILVLMLSCASLTRGQAGGPTPKAGAKMEKGKDAAKNPLTIEGLKLSPGSILVLVDDLKDVLALVPKMVLIRPEKLLEMEDRIKALEKLLKADRRPASVCKLSGKVEGDLIHFRGEFLFSTEQPNALVFLGMQGAFLKEEGDLDRALSQLEVVDDGYVVKVDKPGNHQLNLNLVAPVGVRRAGLGSSGAERSIDLGLPGSTVTTLSLELPSGVKELRWNDNPEKRRGTRWDIALGKTKTLALTWREPVTLPGTGPLLTVEAQIVGKIEETQVIWNADLQLEDLRGQAKEWHFVFPPGAKAGVKTAGGLGYDFRAVEGKPYTHILELRDPGTDRWVVEVQVFQPRPDPGIRMAVGPYQVLGAYRQQGSITIEAAPEALRGQRLQFHRFGEIHQKDTPKTESTLATFQYWSMPSLGKGGKGMMRPPLELEWKLDRGRVETKVEHDLHLQESPAGKSLEITTRIRFKKRPAGLDVLEVQLPRAIASVRTGSFHEPLLPFPGGVPWMEIISDWGMQSALTLEEYGVEGDGDAYEWLPTDAAGRARIRFLRPAEASSVLVLRGRCRLPAEARRVRLELPRPLGVTEASTTATVKAAEGIEFMSGKLGKEQPVAGVNEFARTWSGPPEPLDISWRPHRPEVLATAVADVTVLDRTAHIVVTMKLSSNAKQGLENLSDLLGRLQPGGPERVRILSGKRDAEAIYEYDADLVVAEKATALEKKSLLKLGFPWPEGVTDKELKVRLWTQAGTRVSLEEEAETRKVWKDRELERVAAKNVLPGAVWFWSGTGDPELRVELTPSAKPMSPLLVDKVLIQVRVDEDGNQFYRARFLLQKIHARRLELEMPTSPAASLETVLLDGIEAPRESSPTQWNVITLKVEPALYVKPVILTVEYRIPASNQEGQRAWRTTFTPVRLLGEVGMPQVQWQVKLPTTWFAFPSMSTIKQRSRWGLMGWLLAPMPAESSFMEVGMGGDGNNQTPSLCLDQATLEPTTILHFSKSIWLLACSSVVLLLGLAVLLISPRRGLVWLFLVVLAAGFLPLAWFWPTLLPALVYGCQPGLVALLLLVLLHWLLNQHYQRQIVFLPSFTRVKMGSSLNRADGSKNLREPSTVDAPAPSGVRKTGTESIS